MSEDWQPGDVAICVDDLNYAPEGGFIPGIKLGGEYLVREAVYYEGPCYSPRGEDVPGEELSLYGALNPCDHTGRYASVRFRKKDSLVDETEQELDAGVAA